ncbi:hypothetical protein [Microbacterium sp. RG1]|uniref:hypothetical protein n=1 Tax=Microbacterium sp. RG1 TaxID=2489212 RepID=UPI0010CA4342|nr:hypothetical protein [Microbacterium sp. RG1]QCQ16993.1 hypothetical protein EHF32_09825 [Microbacterium sp. RG1]
MSWFSRFMFGPPAAASTVLGLASMATGVTPLWGTPSELQPLVYSDIYGPTGSDAVTRDTAMTVAPVKRGRNLIVSKLSDLPMQLGAWDASGAFAADATQPGWFTSTGSPQTAWHRIALTLDDLIFHGWSLWVVERDAFGQITAAGRIARSRWNFDASTPTGIRVDQVPVTDPADVVLFAGPDEGLLITARESIRGWRHMEKAWVGRVRSPIPAMILEEIAAGSIDPAKAMQYVQAIATNRTSEFGMVAFIPAELRLRTEGQVEPDLFDKGRNAARIDIANHLGLPVALLDGSPATASLTYSTQEGTRSQLIDDLEMWLAPIEARLSENDVTPEGKAIRFNRTNLTNVPNDPYGASGAAPHTAPTAPQELTA